MFEKEAELSLTECDEKLLVRPFMSADEHLMIQEKQN